MLKLMIVDDEEFIRLGISKIISRMDFNIDIIGSHGNGMDALAQINKLEDGDLDVLITDIKMPVLDGLRLIERLQIKLREVSVIILSGFHDFDYVRTAMRYGVADYLLKPIDKTQLLELLEKFEHQRLDRSMELNEQIEAEDTEQIVAHIKHYLHTEYAKPFDPDQLVEQLGHTDSYLNRLFKQETAWTIADYLIDVRIGMAKQLMLASPQLKLYEISLLVGYPDQIFFNQLFKKMAGVTPQEFRSML